MFKKNQSSYKDSRRFIQFINTKAQNTTYTTSHYPFHCFRKQEVKKKLLVKTYYLKRNNNKIWLVKNKSHTIDEKNISTCTEISGGCVISVIIAHTFCNYNTN